MYSCCFFKVGCSWGNPPIENNFHANEILQVFWHGNCAWLGPLAWYLYLIHTYTVAWPQRSDKYLRLARSARFRGE